MKFCYISKRFSDERRQWISAANAIIADYQSQGYRLTLRQLYYQFVSKNLLPNTERSYKNLGNAISDARLAGLIDWNAIEDRVRVPRINSEFDDIEDLVSVAIRAYRLPRWKGQGYYVELWVEKDALAGVLAPLAAEYHVTMMVNRGYSSQSAMHEAAMRFKSKDGDGVLLYLGDHDPSGEDMVRDIDDRLTMFGAEVVVTKLALTRDQIDEYDPPPNPAKMSDSRAASYVARHGDSSWEVDALPPQVLDTIIRKGIEEHLDQTMMEKVKEEEAKDKAALMRAVKKLK